MRWSDTQFVPLEIVAVKHRDVVGRIPAFQTGGPGSIPGDNRNFNLYYGTGCVSFVFVLSCGVSGESPDVLLASDSGSPLVFWSKVCAPLMGIWPVSICVVCSTSVIPTLEEVE